MSRLKRRKENKREMDTIEIRKTVVVDAAAEVVFKALTDEKELVQWMPREAKMDARVGGEFEFKYQWAAKGLNTILRGKILELLPNKRLSYTWDAETAEHEKRVTGAVVTWNLESLPGGKTRVTLVQTGVARQFSEDADKGWVFFTGRLAEHCKRHS
ncbi:MAG: SRPBCC domain-containing protein [Thaumarchaeota archaeon]|nr:SRPBCC domain-containing protein [Nitrososphaerota archaeon]MCL5067994.1 SRPBCC domain-containing protein [Nitrososphaerota archaeon]